MIHVVSFCALDRQGLDSHQKPVGMTRGIRMSAASLASPDPPVGLLTEIDMDKFGGMARLDIPLTMFTNCEIEQINIRISRPIT